MYVENISTKKNKKVLTIILYESIVADVDKTPTQNLVQEGGKRLIDTQALEEAIKKSGKTKTYLSNKIGISIQSLRLKTRGDYQFNTDEVGILCEELNITRLSDKERIFFAKNVDKKTT